MSVEASSALGFALGYTITIYTVRVQLKGTVNLSCYQFIAVSVGLWAYVIDV